MVDITTSITIRQPVGIVASYASDPDNAPVWYVNIESAVWKTPPPLAVGSQVAFSARFLGRTLAYTYEIVAYTPGQQLVMRTAEGPFPMETTYTWTILDEHTTRMTLRNAGEPRGFSKLMAPLMSAAMRRANHKDLHRLKQILESQFSSI